MAIAITVTNTIRPIPAFGPFLVLSTAGMVLSIMSFVSGIASAQSRDQVIIDERRAISKLPTIRIGVELAHFTNHIVRTLDGRRTRARKRLIAEPAHGNDPSAFEVMVVDPITINARTAMRASRVIVISSNAVITEDVKSTYGESIEVIKNFKGLLPIFNVDPRTPTKLSQEVIWLLTRSALWLLPFVISSGILVAALVTWMVISGLE